MKYRITADLIFEDTELTLANNIYKQINTHAAKLQKIQGVREECSFIQLEECHHDDGKPCVILKKVQK